MWGMTPNAATMSIIGLKQYNQYLFDDLHLPADIDSATVTNNIIYTCAELEVIYPDPYFMQFAIGEWSKKELPIWEKIREMETADYNPIENYDRYDNEVETTDRARENKKNDTINSTSKADATTASETTNNGVNTAVSLDKVAGFNTDTLATNAQNTTSNTDATTGKDESTTESNSTGASVQNTVDKGNENENRVKSLHSHGNIGVTTVATMIQEQMKILPEVNTVNYICESFKRRFCLLVY